MKTFFLFTRPGDRAQDRGLRLVAALLALGAASAAQGQITSLDLADYRLTGWFNLPTVDASEASGITYNWDTGTLFVVGDEGDAIVEVTPGGVHVSTMALSGFGDTEGLTYIGGGRFVIVEERIQTAYRLTYSPSEPVSRSSLESAVLGPSVGNDGLEGISYDPPTGQFFAVKEKSPQAVWQATLDFGGTGTSVTSPFTPFLNMADLSGIQALSTVPSLAGTADQDNLLIVSQASAVLKEASRDGAVLSQFDLSFSSIAEGVTIDSEGVIYIVTEMPRVYVLTSVGHCAADMDGSGGVDVFDLLAYLDLWFASDAAAELTGDAPASINVFDLLAYLDSWFAGC